MNHCYNNDELSIPSCLYLVCNIKSVYKSNLTAMFMVFKEHTFECIVHSLTSPKRHVSLLEGKKGGGAHCVQLGSVLEVKY